LNDYTDQGLLYDPAQSAYWYKWTAPTSDLGLNDDKWGKFTPFDESSPVGYLNYYGRWGDARYPKNDKRQRSVLDMFFKYEDGPTGPGDKDLGRENVWSGSNHKIWDKLVP
jgi:hypothetical protein